METEYVEREGRKERGMVEGERVRGGRESGGGRGRGSGRGGA